MNEGNGIEPNWDDQLRRKIFLSPLSLGFLIYLTKVGANNREEFRTRLEWYLKRVSDNALYSVAFSFNRDLQSPTSDRANNSRSFNNAFDRFFTFSFFFFFVDLTRIKFYLVNEGGFFFFFFFFCIFFQCPSRAYRGKWDYFSSLHEALARILGN